MAIGVGRWFSRILRGRADLSPPGRTGSPTRTSSPSPSGSRAPARPRSTRPLGINLYVGLWKGPTEEQLAELKKHGMRVICAQNEVGLRHQDDPTIVGWMHGDEPDNAQSLGRGKGYGPPILPANDRRGLPAASRRPTRRGRCCSTSARAWPGTRYSAAARARNHPEDYPEYLKGCDIASFDIYPVVHDHRDVAGKLWFVADGVSRLRKWSDDKQAVWNCIECTHISNPDAKATPQQVKAEVWMSLIHGSRGLIYFVHQFKPKFIEAGLLADEEMATAVGRDQPADPQPGPGAEQPPGAGRGESGVIRGGRAGRSDDETTRQDRLRFCRGDAGGDDDGKVPGRRLDGPGHRGGAGRKTRT